MRYLRILLVLIIVFFIFNCAKKTGKRDKNYGKMYYVKENSVWVFFEKEDFGKKVREVKKKKNLEFGHPVKIREFDRINEEMFYRIELKNKSLFWLKKNSLAEDMFAIKTDNIECYNMPDENFNSDIKLQKGDLGIYKKEIKGWINADFWAYRPVGDRKEKKFVGNRWIKKIKKHYTKDNDIVREAYFLYQSYYYYFTEKDENISEFFLRKGLKIKGNTKPSFVTSILKEFEKRIKK